jgi:hypothetical protein
VFGDLLEVSLDCCVCRRCWRTVAFEAGRPVGTCVRTGHAFPGRTTAKETARASVTYRFEYPYEPFEDAKYPGIRHPRPGLSWARVHFTATCPACGTARPCSVQSNESRRWTTRCDCGRTLYTQWRKMPRLRPGDGTPEPRWRRWLTWIRLRAR